MRTARRRAIVASTLLTLATVLAACSAPSAQAPEVSSSSSTPPPSSIPTPVPTASSTSTAELTCSSILPAETVAAFEELGWSAREEPMRMGDVELTDGLQCTWGNYDIATDMVQIFGWAPTTDAESAKAQDQLLTSGWRREDSADGVYVTESLETAIAPVDGYGITYLFGDGWVTVADTKQGLLLIERPQT